MTSAGVLSTAVYFPEKIITADHFIRNGAKPETLERWGVQQFHVAEHETGTDLEAKAGLLAIERAGLKPEDIDLVLGVKLGAEKANPPNVLRTHFKMGLTRAAAFEVDLACAGAIPAMTVADLFIRSGQYKHVLLIGSCWLNDTKDSTDLATFAVLGDGASAVVLGPVPEGRGILSSEVEVNGRFFDNVGIEIRPPRRPELASDPTPRPFFYIDTSPRDGFDFMEYALESVPNTAKKLLTKEGISVSQVDWVCCHQNVDPICREWVRRMEIPQEKAIFTHHKYGNLGPANLWANLHEGVVQGKFADGDLILFMAQGSGFASAALLLRWSEVEHALR